MNIRTMNIGILGLALLVLAGDALAQTSSLGKKRRVELERYPEEPPPRETPPTPRNKTYIDHSWISAPAPVPRTYAPGDLLTIIIREQRTWEAESELDTRRQFDVLSQLSAFVDFIDGGVGETAFSRGQPNIDYRMQEQLRSEGEQTREDRLVTRLTARIIDVKPNGLLVIEGRARVIHDDEMSEITVTGTCRKEDVTADNTILSTQVADKEVAVANKGALRSASSRGWILKLLDLLRPF